jgi:hypothetical protein
VGSLRWLAQIGASPVRTLQRFLAAALCGIAVAHPVAAQVSTAATADDSVQALRALDIVEGQVALQGLFTRGDHIVAAGDTIRGALVTFGGSADVQGTVLGNVTAVFGDVTVRDGANIRGSATAWRGRVIVEGGRVAGALRASPRAAARATTPPLSTGAALKLSAGWTAMLLIVGLVALVVASRNLDATARMLEQGVGRAFFVGVAGQLGFLPLVLLAVVALAVTLIGILLIPFALVAAPVAFAGLVTLGWMATALMIGRALLRTAPGQDRAAMIRALVPGVVLLMLPWIVAAALQEAGTVVVVARAFATGVTWVAATLGLGAAVLSRAGTASTRAARPATPAAMTGWQTPTPIGGVAAARRPVAARPEAPTR